MIRRLLVTLLCLAAVLGGSGARHAAGQPEESVRAPSIRFRRVLVPAASREDWPLGQQKYLPVAPEDFERLLAASAGPLPDTERLAASPRLVYAEYEARLDGDRLTEGRGTLRVEHASEERALLRLEPCGLAVRGAVWAGEESRPATLGLGVDECLDLLVEQPGRLQIEWSLAGARDTAGALSFPLRFPACPINSLLLETRDDVEIAVDHGTVLDAGRGEEGMRRWRIEFGNRFEAELRVAAPESEAARHGLAIVRERTSYDLSLRGVEVAVEWDLEIHHEPLSMIDLKIDEQLQLVSAKLGEEAVPWTVTPSAGGGQSRVSLRLPKPVQGTGLVLRLGALTPLVTGQTWRLPRIRPEGIFWQEGSATLMVRAPLVIEQFAPVGCRQTGAEALAPPRQGESFQLQFFHPDATAELEVVEYRDRVEITSGTSIQWGEEEVRAAVRADFRLKAGTRFQLAADLGPRWMVDSVESAPADAIDQWTVEPDGQGGRQLVVRLARALAPGRPIRLSVGARRLGASLGQALAIHELAPLHFDNDVSGRQLLGLRTPDACKLEYIGSAGGHVVPGESLQPTEVELLGADQPMTVFRLEGSEQSPQVRLTALRPKFLAEVEVEARLGKNVLKEEYRIRCKPESARLDRIVVWLSRHRDDPLEWAIAGEQAVRVSARQWTSDEQLAAGLSADGEVWDIRLDTPIGQPLEIVAHRESSFSGEMSPSLASVPDAESQSGLLAIHAVPGAGIHIDNRRLRQVPPEPLPSDRSGTLRATYHYDPWREVGRLAEPAVIVSGRVAEQPALALVWEALLDSRFDTDGTGCHVAVFHVENLGEDVLRIHLPAEARGSGPVEVWVDRRRIDNDGIRAGTEPRREVRRQQGTPTIGAPHDELRVPLPLGRKYPTVTLAFASKQPRFLPVGQLRALWPEPSVPVLSRSWSVWLPPGYAAYGCQAVSSPVPLPALNWNERLVGPLGRPVGQAAFDPFSADDWLAVRGDANDRREAVQRVEEWLRQGAASRAASDTTAAPAAHVNLRTILTHETTSGLRRRLLVDREALARRGISFAEMVAGRPIPAVPEDHLFAHSGLALLLCRDAALLTTQTVAARLRPHLDPMPIAHVWWIHSRPLAGRLAWAGQNGDDAAFPPATSWVEQSGDPPGPWMSDRLPGREPGDQFGWQAVAVPGGGGVGGLRYYHEHSLRLAGSIALLLAVSGGWWLARNRPLALLGTACLAGLAGLALPEPFVPVASGVVLGSLFCLAFRMVHRHLAPRAWSRQSAVHPPPSSVSAMVPWGLALLVATAVAGSCRSAYGGEAQLRGGSGGYRVFIPVDDEKQPVGGKYYLPEPLFAELHRLAAARRELPQGWLLGNATYRGEVMREPAGERFLVDEIRAQFDLHVLSPSARVQIPLDRGAANLLPDGVSVDGRVVQVEWAADNRALAVEIAEPGHYQVELRMRPQMRVELPAGFDLSIPPLPMAQLDLALPSGAPAIEVPTARGAVRREDAPARIVAELGPARLLSVRWPLESGPAGAGPAVDIEELLWIKVQPGSVLVEAKWKMTIVEGQMRRLRLAADPRMRLLPLAGDRSPAVRTLAGEDELNRLVLEWPEPLQEPTVVAARFLLTGTSGVGNLRVPQLELLDGRITRRWMAVSVADGLQFEQSGKEKLVPVPLPEFLAAWEATDSAPSFAFRLPAGVPDWTLATRPREPKTSVEKDLTLRFAEHATDVTLKARLVTASGYGFHYRIAAPEPFEVTRMALLAEGVDRTVRWSQDAGGTIDLFLAGPVSGEQNLVVEGRLPDVPGQPVPVPAFRVEGADHIGTTLHVMRKPGVLVEVQSGKGLLPIETPATKPQEPGQWRPVGSYRIGSGAEPAASITARANRPNLAGREILRLSAVEGAWEARWECRLDVSDGLLEELLVEAPANWGNRLRASDGLAFNLTAAQGPRQELVLRPEQPVGGRWLAWVSGRLQLTPGEPVAVPDIALSGDHAIDRFVILPRQIGGRAVDWQIHGLQPIALSEVVPELASEYGVLAAYRILGKPFSAELPELPTSWDAGRVHLAEYAMQWQEDGSLRGAARFDIEPGVPSVCAIQFPNGAVPVLLEVDGVPAQLAGSPDSGVYEVQLGAPGVPQRVEAVFEAGVAWPIRNMLHLAAPRVVKMPVERTIWTFSAPSYQVASLSEDVRRTTALQTAFARLECLDSLLERYAAVTGDDSASALRWYRQWLHRWVAAREAVREEIRRLPEKTEQRAATERINELTGQQSGIAARLDAADVLAELLETDAAARAGSDAWHAAFFQGRRLLVEQAAGALPEIAVQVTPLPAAPVVARVLAGAGWVLLLGLVAIGLRRGLLVEVFRRWPQAIGVLAGLAWWLWLSPSVLGLLLVAACVATSVRSGWRSLSGPGPDASGVSVLRS